MKNKFYQIYEDHGIGIWLLCVILVLGLVFGIWCAFAALLMVCWNYAVVAAIPICSTIGFWQAFVLGLAVRFLFSFRTGISVGSKNN